MPRVYIRKTQRAVDENAVKMALRDCFKNKVSIREAARRHNLKRDTLMSRIKAVKKRNKEDVYLKSSDSGVSSTDEEGERSFHSKYSVNQVFSVSEEKSMVKYIKKSSELHYGLTYRQVRVLAYDYASKIRGCKIPKNWTENKIAGEDWLYGFMTRHSELSLRKPESTSLLRSVGFNKDRVDEFFENYCSELQKYKFKPEEIFNLDESGVTTVIRPPRVVAEKGKKQIGQVSSGERGELVTFVGVINAVGNTLPPIYVVPRMRNPEDYITGAPASSLILNNKSGWMTKELFVKVLDHIKIHTHCTKDHRILLLLDNHESHVSYESIKFCKDNGISLVSFPPHTTHRLQPLDVGVFGPFKGSLSVAFNDWMLSNPGRAITIRNLGELTNIAFNRAFSISNITNAFKKPGIWPVNRQAFNDDDFAASTVTDKDIAVQGEIEPEINYNADTQNIHNNDTSQNEPTQKNSKDPTATSADVEVTGSTSEKSVVAGTSKHLKKIVLEDIKPFPKARREEKKKRNRQSKSKIYTSTPEMAEMKKAEEEKQAKLRKNCLKSSKTPKRKVFADIEEESESDTSLELIDSDTDSSVDEFPLIMEGDSIINVNDFVLAKFPMKTTTIYYIGQILAKELNQYDISFLRRKNNSFTFAFPVVADISNIERDDIVAVFPPPQSSGTARTASLYTFKFNFKGWNVR